MGTQTSQALKASDLRGLRYLEKYALIPRRELLEHPRQRHWHSYWQQPA